MMVLKNHKRVCSSGRPDEHRQRRQPCVLIGFPRPGWVAETDDWAGCGWIPHRLLARWLEPELGTCFLRVRFLVRHPAATKSSPIPPVVCRIQQRVAKLSPQAGPYFGRQGLFRGRGRTGPFPVRACRHRHLPQLRAPERTVNGPRQTGTHVKNPWVSAFPVRLTGHGLAQT
jgi:hypothetical protein